MATITQATIEYQPICPYHHGPVGSTGSGWFATKQGAWVALRDHIQVSHSDDVVEYRISNESVVVTT